MIKGAVVLFLLLFAVLLIAGCSGVRPANLGVKDGKLAPCPASPNCVSSQGADKTHSIDPLHYTGTAAEAKARVKELLRSMKRNAIIMETDTYMHIEFTSALWRFVDDMELWIDDSAKLIHIRSASRLGSSDMGVNRSRVETIRTLWQSAGIR